MRHYTVSNSKGSFIKSDMDNKEETSPDNTTGNESTPADTIQKEQRQKAVPQKKKIQ